MGAPVIAPIEGEAEAAVLAGWIWEEWAQHEPGVQRADSDAAVHAALRGARMPYFAVARVDGAAVGCVSITADDLPTRPDLGPWLANVYVLPAWRGRGLGTALVEHAMGYGATIADRLYLYTFGGTALYTRLGWRPYATGHYAGRPITLLRYDATRRNPRWTRSRLANGAKRDRVHSTAEPSAPTGQAESSRIPQTGSRDTDLTDW